ncbi:MAG: hypothetical protein KDA75_18835 [Planctomycetaceae bacterium]|nr:hypothetical protein [Planctomycetaceae bacterium]
MFRFTVESAILLAVAVTLFRAFFAEGYMISTGSMAPSLLGYHRQVCCPSCAYRFARGAATDADNGTLTANASAGLGWLDDWDPVTTRCPNCGSAVSDDAVPRTEGDQLMVHKHHYDWRDPARWEVAVFRNPSLQTQAYVKRTVGLPGETIEIVDGDVYADGVLQRKPLEVQQSLRVPVDDHDYQPTGEDPDWQPRWRAEQAETNWRTDGRQFHFQGTPQSSVEGATSYPDWVHYHHWVRSGGQHHCRVPLERWPDDVAEPGLLHHQFRFDAERRELESVGAIPHSVYQDWSERVRSDAARDALRTLYFQSHQPPLTDVCAYNHPEAVAETYPVHDLMLELNVTAEQAAGQFLIALHDGCHELRCTFDFDAGEARLTADGEGLVHRQGSLPQAFCDGEPAVVTMSQFDRQLLVAIDGELLFEPLLYASDSDRPPLPEHPVKFGASDGRLLISHVKLYRDVYYTASPDGLTESYTLGDDEFFMLGDNSPVSLDSRAWPHPAVPRSLLIGRPFVVHLPSKPQSFQLGSREVVLRIPDFSRVRYIR